MGGNALKKTEQKPEFSIERCDANHLNVVYTKLELTLKDFFSEQEIYDVQIATPRFIYDKKSFGDLDVVVGDKSFDKKKLYQHLENKLNTPEIVTNGDISSFAYPLSEKTFFQVDLIFTTKDEFLPMLNYLGDNDLSNLTGRLSRFLGVKLSMKGLEVPLEYNGQKIKDQQLLLTTDMKDILTVLDLDYKKYLEGFHTINELYDYITHSKYFHKNLYLLENGNHVDRKKDGVRPNYVKFLDYIKDRNDLKDDYDKGFNQEQFVKNIIIQFDKTEDYVKIFEDIKHKELFKNHFNATIVSELFHVKNQELGLLMAKIKKHPTLMNDIEKTVFKMLDAVDTENIQGAINSYLKKEIEKIIINKKGLENELQ